MTDREPLLAAIKANPKDHLPRLVYADWLDEFGNTDQDAATAEFIRLACRMEKRTVKIMPRDVYPWLGMNWQRLVPDLVPLFASVPIDKTSKTVETYQVYNDHRLTVYWRGRILHGPIRLYPYPELGWWTEFEFFDGFVVRYTPLVRVNNQTDLVKYRDLIQTAIGRDQPLARLTNLSNRELNLRVVR